MDLADRVRHADTALDAKDVVRHLPPNPEWERVKVPTLQGLFIARLSQHPDLMEAFLKTAPHRLIEASCDSLCVCVNVHCILLIKFIKSDLAYYMSPNLSL